MAAILRQAGAKNSRVLLIEPQSQSELIRQIVDFGLTSRQVKQLVDENSEPQEVADQPTVSRAAIKFAKSTKDTKKTTGDELAQALLLQEQDVGIALARLKAMRELIDDAEQKLLEN
jgi:ParB family transcriptional regulator, chromosome partitioning protein